MGSSFSVDMPAPPARHRGLSALFCPAPACTPLSSTPLGSSCHSPSVQGALLGLSCSHLPSLPMAGSPSSYQLLMQNAGGQLWSQTDPHKILGTVTVGFQAVYLNSLCLGFPICKMGITVYPIGLMRTQEAKSGARPVTHNTCPLAPKLSFICVINTQYYNYQLAYTFPHPDCMNNLSTETGVPSAFLAQGLA